MIGLFVERNRVNKKLFLLFVLASCLFWLMIGDDSFASEIGKKEAIPIPVDRMTQPFSPLTMDGDRFCIIHSDSDSVAWYYPETIPGNGFALYMNPQMCEENPYPFKLTGVQFTLYDYSNGLTAIWPVEILVSIKQVKVDTSDTICPELGKPGLLYKGYSQTFTIPIDSSYDSLGGPMNLDLDSLTTPILTSCLDTAVFLEITFTGGTDPPFPGLVMSDSVLDFPDSCRAWFLDEGKYYEWSTIWGPPAPGEPIPGCPIMRIMGYTTSMDCDLCWDWKEPDGGTAPHGMPDFDQYQFGDSSAMDVPTAVANCLWRFDAVPEDTTAPDLIRLLSTYFSTDSDTGTLVSLIQSGLATYFSEYGFNLRADIFFQPDFHEMADSLRGLQNIVLILGFWQYDGDTWHRFGGHAVTFAGVCSESLWVGLGDPAVDGAELEWQGRIFPLGHPPHPENDTLHNNSIYVSHDIYVSDTSFIDYGDSLDTLWRIKDFYADSISLFAQFEKHNFQPGQMKYFNPYQPSDSVYTVVEYAIMICPTTAVEEEEEIVTPEDFQLFQNHPNPFNNETIIKYTLSRSSQVSLTIYNILGQKVRRLLHEYQKPGVKTVSWDGKDEGGKELSSGIYFYRLSAGSIGKDGEIAQTKRMILLK